MERWVEFRFPLSHLARWGRSSKRGDAIYVPPCGLPSHPSLLPRIRQGRGAVVLLTPSLLERVREEDIEGGYLRVVPLNGGGVLKVLDIVLPSLKARGRGSKRRRRVRA